MLKYLVVKFHDVYKQLLNDSENNIHISLYIYIFIFLSIYEMWIYTYL